MSVRVNGSMLHPLFDVSPKLMIKEMYFVCLEGPCVINPFLKSTCKTLTPGVPSSSSQKIFVFKEFTQVNKKHQILALVCLAGESSAGNLG